MKTIRVAGIQMPVLRNVEKNRDAILEAIEHAAREKAQILLTPEGALSGYTHEIDPPAVRKALAKVTAFARKKHVGLALGTCMVEDDGKCYNELRFYKPSGEFLGFHTKTLCCGSHDDPSKGEVNHYGVLRLRVFAWRPGLLIGGLICNDMWANPGCTPMPDPHLTQKLSQMGARIIFHAVNGGRDGSEWSEVGWRYHESNLRMRARSGRVWIVTVDNCYPERIQCAAPCGVVAPDGSWFCRTASKGSQFFCCTIKL